MLDDFSHELDSTHSRLDNVMKKLAKVSHMTSGRSWEVVFGPRKGETSAWVLGLGRCVLPPTQSRAEGREQLWVHRRLEAGKTSKACSCLCPDTAPQPVLSLCFIYRCLSIYVVTAAVGKSPSQTIGGKALQPPALLARFPGHLLSKSFQGGIKLCHRACVAPPRCRAPFQTSPALGQLAPALQTRGLSASLS